MIKSLWYIKAYYICWFANISVCDSHDKYLYFLVPPSERLVTSVAEWGFNFLLPPYNTIHDGKHQNIPDLLTPHTMDVTITIP